MKSIRKFQTPKTFLDDFDCQVVDCGFKADSCKGLLKHYRKDHDGDAAFESSCIYSKECFHKEKFKTYSNLYYHLQTYHLEVFQDPAPALDSVARSRPERDNVENDPASIVSTVGVPNTENQAVADTHPSLHAGEFVMKLLADHKLTQVDMQAIMTGASELVRKTVDTKLQETVALLKDIGCSHTPLFESLRLDSSLSIDVFAGLRGQYSQIKFFKENYGLIMPRKVKLPDLEDNFARQRTRCDQEFVVHEFVAISLLDQVEQLLNIKAVYHAINNPTKSVPGVYSSYRDGKFFKTIPLFKNHPNALQIHLYLDEVQLCNPVGSYTHKIVFVYFSLANLDPQFRSSYKCIHLLAMFYHEQVAKYDINTFLKPIVDEIQKLEEGYGFNFQGRTEIVYGTLTAVVADNLASHQVGGFKAGFATGHRKCRSCLALDVDIQSKFRDRQFTPRSRAEHDKQCEGLSIDDLRQHYSWLYGINQISILSKLKYYHVIGGLAPDIMHDILEGVLPLALALFIGHCIEQNFFTLKQLNHIIANFNYGPSEVKDKPAPISRKNLNDETIRGSATQKWLLAVYLPIMIGKKIDPNDPCLNCFILLLEICRLVFKISISNAELLNLEELIVEFLTSFKKCYPSRRLIPKMHHLVHYPRFIRELGPLGSVWCMRYEAKHSYFKSLQRRSGNWINVPWSLSYRHQQWICNKLQLKSAVNFLKFETVVSKKLVVSFSNYSYCGQLSDYFNFNDFLPFLASYSWVQIGSIKFKQNESVVILRAGDRANFGLIVNIFEHGKKFVFVCKVFKTKYFDKHYQAFRICERRDNFHIVVAPSQLLDFRTYSVHVPGFVTPFELKGDKFIVTKTDFLDEFKIAEN